MGKLRTKQEFRESMKKIGQDLSDAYAKKAMALYSKPEVEEEKKEEKEKDEIEVKSEEENEKRYHPNIRRSMSTSRTLKRREKGGNI